MEEKTGKILSCRLQKDKTSRLIPDIHSGHTIIKEPRGINKRFKEFNEELYKKGNHINKNGFR